MIGQVPYYLPYNLGIGKVRGMLGGVSFGKIGTQETYAKTSFQRQFIAKRQKAKTAAKEKMSEENVKAALT